MHEHDALIDSYEHLDKFPRAPDALHALRKVASLVKPIMRNHGWRVGTLSEFYPDQRELLGLNINKGAKICLRLRYPGDRNQFMPLENVVDTMLHELSHNVHGPHNQDFQALWNALRDEYEGLKMKGYTGEGFLSEGHRLGGRRIPMNEMRRQARAAAEKRKALTKGSGQKIGGTPLLRGTDMRRVIADAAERRGNNTARITTGCASGTLQGQREADQASKNGFRTKAEEEDANQRAIEQALWEIVQEEEARNAGLEPDSWRSEGLVWNPGVGLDLAPPSSSKAPAGPALPPRASKRAPSAPSRTDSPQRRPPPVPTSSKPAPGPGATQNDPRTGRPVSRLVAEADSKKKTASQPPLAPPPYTAAAHPATDATSPQAEPSSNWTCAVCTLWNPAAYLACDACGAQRPNSRPSHDTPSSAAPPPPPNRATAHPAGANGVGGVPYAQGSHADVAAARARARASEQAGQRLGWNCRACGTFMEARWWTCSRCGLMKASS